MSFNKVKINFGCGNNPLIGYVNYDKFPIDERVKYIDLNNLPLLFPNNSVDEILLSHVLEHLTDPYGVVLECYRILKPGGVLRVNLPSTLRASLPHLRTGFGPSYFYCLTRKYTGSESNNFFNVSVSFGTRYRGFEYLYMRWQNFRDWFLRQFFDEYRYKLVKK